MPTSRPETGSQYIEISDFSPGIHSDWHASTPPRYTAGADTPSTAGNLPGNGIARASGTFRCHADKTGALVPLPRADATGTRDTLTPHLQFESSRPYRYVLDAQVGAVLTDAGETVPSPQMTSRQLFQVIWGMYLVPES